MLRWRPLKYFKQGERVSPLDLSFKISPCVTEENSGGGRKGWKPWLGGCAMAQAFSDGDLNLGRGGEGEAESVPVPAEQPVCTLIPSVQLCVHIQTNTHPP